MKGDWIIAYKADKEFKAEIIKRMFADNDIESLFINKTDSCYPHLGEVEIYIRRDNIIKALKLIEDFNRE